MSTEVEDAGTRTRTASTEVEDASTRPANSAIWPREEVLVGDPAYPIGRMR